MGHVSFVFAGQGAQHIGMGQSLYESSGAVRTLFDRAEQHRPGTLAMMFSGEEAILKQTENTQPCLYLADLAAAIALTEGGLRPHSAAGFSLGEVSALAYAGAMDPITGFDIVTLRGTAMARAAATHPAAMAAIVKLSNEQVEAICARFEAVYPVNYNCPGQLVISTRTETMEALTAAVREAGGRLLPLKVSGGFHSPFMAEAAEEFGAYLTDIAFTAPQIPLYANTTADRYPADIPGTLTAQILSPVRWESIIRQMAADGTDTFIECGPGTTLCGLINRILPDTRTYAAETAEQVAAILQEVGV